jgi:HK97 family phage prohead protease
LAKFITLNDFKQQAKAGEKPPDSALQKRFILEKTEFKGESDKGIEIQMTISTGNIDRDGDTLSPDGWKLENYAKNPVVLFAHQSRQPPVARATKTWLEDEKLKSTALFTPQDMYPFGYMIGQMYKEGFINAASVGFDPLKWAYVEDKNRPWGVDFLEMELLEWSAVPVPANAEALLDAKSKGVDTQPLYDFAVQVLDGCDLGLWLPKKTAETIFGTLNKEKIFSIPQKPKEEKQPELLSLYQKRIQLNKNKGGYAK